MLVSDNLGEGGGGGVGRGHKLQEGKEGGGGV